MAKELCFQSKLPTELSLALFTFVHLMNINGIGCGALPAVCILRKHVFYKSFYRLSLVLEEYRIRFTFGHSDDADFDGI